MNTTRPQNLIAALAFTTTGARAAGGELVESKDINTRIGKLSFTHGFANGAK